MKILVIDDHPLFLQGVLPLLRQLDTNAKITTAGTRQAAMEIMQHEKDFHLILLDLHLPDSQELSLLQLIREQVKDIPIVLLTASNRRSDMQGAIAKGAKGYICKSTDPVVVLNALGLVLAGGIYIPPEMVQGDQGSNTDIVSEASEDFSVDKPLRLTPRQSEVLNLLIDGEGRSNKEIANLIGCSEATIKVHVTALLKAMNVSKRTQLISAAKQVGLAIETSEVRA